MAEFDTTADPLALFADWLSEAEGAEPEDPNAMALATADASGMPNVRMVLLKGHDERGFVFYSNGDSVKGGELSANPHAALCFHWKSLGKQVRIRGGIAEVPAEEADAYFATRPKGSRIGAWASQQSRPLESRFALEKAVAKYGAKYAVGDIPRPDYWKGYRLRPASIEFWRKQAFRLHERLHFTPDADGAWRGVWLYP
jgi:pyridoxamine 5'-phosphate oxidase